jgi:MATE family multidrug resistance protein
MDGTLIQQPNSEVVVSASVARWDRFPREMPAVVGLVWPLVLANLGWMMMGIVDTMMVGRVSAEAIGAVSLGSVLYITVGVFGGYLLIGLETLVSQAFGAGDLEDCRHSLVNSLCLAVPVAAVLMGFVWAGAPALARFGINAEVLRQAVPYIRALNWSTPALLLYFVFRSYLQALSHVRAVMFALITANLVNAAGNWVLIYGHLGFRAMGAEGSGWSTSAARLYMAVILLAFMLYYEHSQKTDLAGIRLRPDLARIRRLLELGFPASMQITWEVAVFAVATALIAKLDTLSLAAHQIALNMASFTFMVPLAVGSAAAVRIGQALGRGDQRAATCSGWTALALGAGFMSCAALTFLLAPRSIARLFTPDPAVIRTGAALLIVAAFFQLFDGLQVVATGALRGTGDTRTPMICHLGGYGLIGLPLGCFLCFHYHWGAVGLWIGLCLALIVIGSVLLVAWHHTLSGWGTLE